MHHAADASAAAVEPRRQPRSICCCGSVALADGQQRCAAVRNGGAPAGAQPGLERSQIDPAPQQQQMRRKLPGGCPSRQLLRCQQQPQRSQAAGDDGGAS
jgi:hypothetical protein